MRVLTVNAGSTSLKLAEITDGERSRQPDDLDEALAGPPPDCVAHRVVHGGEREAATLLDDAVVDELRGLVELAPLHQPPALDAIARCRRAWPDVPNVACFDTAFHATIPVPARTYALPKPQRDQVRSYGFHGLSHAWSSARIAAVAPTAKRLLVAHLGGGQSLCAVLDGRSVMTTMGLTPLDGLVMGTRCGAIDPGAVLWLAAREGVADIGDLLETRSGLLGLCGTAELREAERRAATGDDEARFALAVWRHRFTTQAGACIAALGGLDALVFTAGIGEHDHGVRRMAADGLAWLGVAVGDTDAGPPDDITEITAPGAAVRTFVVAAREDLQLAAEAAAVISG